MSTETAGTVARPGTVIGVLSLVGLLGALCMTLTVPLVPQLPALLSTSAANTSWVVTATLLASAVATPTAGRLGDMFGKRRLLLVTVVALVAGGVLCALTSQLIVLLIGRALQGAAVSAIPLGISIMRDTLPAERLASGVALMSATLGIGSGLGLPLSAFIVQVADWHVLFWAASGLGVIGGVLIVLVVPESPTRTGGRFDAVGSVLLSIGLVCLLLVISKGGEWGWGSATTVGTAVAGVVVLLGWGAYELRTPAPLVDLRTSSRRAVLVPNLISIPIGVSIFTGLVVYPQLLHAPVSTGFGLGLETVVAGLVLAPFGLAMLLVSPLTARISAAMGPRAALRTGLVLLVVGYGLGVAFVSAWWQISLAMAVAGAGVALSYGSMPALIMRAVPVEETAAANGLNTVMRSVGQAVASAMAAVVLAASTVTVGGVTTPSLGGIRLTLLIAGLCGLVSLVATLAIPRRVSPAPTRHATPTVPERVDDGLRGRVRLDDGAPARGAYVTLVDLDGRQLAAVAVDDDGAFRAPVGRPATILMIASAVGFRPTARHVGPHEFAEPHDVVLAAARAREPQFD